MHTDTYYCHYYTGTLHTSDSHYHYHYHRSDLLHLWPVRVGDVFDGLGRVYLATPHCMYDWWHVLQQSLVWLQYFNCARARKLLQTLFRNVRFRMSLHTEWNTLP